MSKTEAVERQEYIEWLVKNRSKNQESCLTLYRLLKKYQNEFAQVGLVSYAQALTGVAFSLWRAVFLGDQEGNRTLVVKHALVVEHAIQFLEKVITDNTIMYTTDKTFNEWTFQYYVGNAHYRIQEMCKKNEGGAVTPWKKKDRDVRERWEYAQQKLDELISALDKHMKIMAIKNKTTATPAR